MPAPDMARFQNGQLFANAGLPFAWYNQSPRTPFYCSQYYQNDNNFFDPSRFSNAHLFPNAGLPDAWYADNPEDSNRFSNSFLFPNAGFPTAAGSVTNFMNPIATMFDSLDISKDFHLPSMCKKDDAECSICLETTIGSKTQTLACSHVFHDDCIKPWLVRNKSCPLCRGCV